MPKYRDDEPPTRGKANAANDPDAALTDQTEAERLYWEIFNPPNHYKSATEPPRKKSGEPTPKPPPPELEQFAKNLRANIIHIAPHEPLQGYWIMHYTDRAQRKTYSIGETPEQFFVFTVDQERKDKTTLEWFPTAEAITQSKLPATIKAAPRLARWCNPNTKKGAQDAERRRPEHRQPA